MEDHHVDRLGVEAWQHVKLTSTNCSIGLIADRLRADPSGSEQMVIMLPRAAARFVGVLARRSRFFGSCAPIHMTHAGRMSGFMRRMCAPEAHMRLDDLVAIARGPHPIPFRTRP